MHKLVILSTVIFAALADVDKRECEKIYDPRASRCCKKTSDLLDKEMQDEGLKKCLEVNMDPALCQYDLCLAKKQSFAIDDKTLDKKKLEEAMTKDLDAVLMKDIKTKCFDGDLTEYGPPDFCEFIKMRLCITAQMLKNCPEWNDNDVCKEFQGLVQECAKKNFF